MRQFKFLFIGIILVSACSLQNHNSYSDTITFFPGIENREGIYFKINSDQPYTGSTESKYSNGESYITASFKDGRLEGTYTAWYLSGNKMGETSYKGGKKEGVSKAWHEDGSKASKAFFKNDHKEGKLEIYYPSGQLNVEAFFKADKLDSTFTQYGIEGNVISVEVYEDGELVGN